MWCWEPIWEKKKFTKSQRYVLYSIGGFACIVSIVEQTIRVDRGYGLEYTLFDYYSPTTIWLTIAVFVFIKYIWRERQIRKWYSRVLLFAGCYSMGIYFLHTIVLLLLQHWLTIWYVSWRPIRSLVDVILVFCCYSFGRVEYVEKINTAESGYS